MGTPTPEQRERSRQRARQRLQLVNGRPVAPSITHGTLTGRGYHGCECDQCMDGDRQWRRTKPSAQPQARAARRQAWLAQREPFQIVCPDGAITRQMVATHLPPHQHGTPSARDYYGCQCQECMDAARRRRRDRHA